MLLIITISLANSKIHLNTSMIIHRLLRSIQILTSPFVLQLKNFINEASSKLSLENLLQKLKNFDYIILLKWIHNPSAKTTNKKNLKSCGIHFIFSIVLSFLPLLYCLYLCNERLFKFSSQNQGIVHYRGYVF